MKTLVAVALCAAGVAACGGNNALSGSAGDIVSLQFDKVGIVSEQGSLGVTYARNDGSVTTKLGVTTTSLDMKSGIVIDGDNFMKYVAVTRSTFDPNDVWPSAINGRVTFDDYSATNNGHVSGSFAVVFAAGGMFQNAGYELLGDFSGNTQVVQ